MKLKLRKPRLGKWVYDTRYSLEHFRFYCISANVCQMDFCWTVRRGQSIIGEGQGTSLAESKGQALACMREEWARMGEVLAEMDTSFRGARAWKHKTWNEETDKFE